MEGLGRILAAPFPATLAGRTLLARPLTLADLGTVENRLLIGRQLLIEEASAAAAKCSAALAARVMRRAVERTRADASERVVSAAELDAFLTSEDGLVFTAWLCLRDNSGCWSLEEVAILIAQSSSEERRRFLKGRDLASGTGSLAALDFPDDDARRRPERRGRQRGGRVSWRQFVREACDNTMSWPDDIGRLTLYQAMLLTADADAIGGTRRLEPGDAVGAAKKRQAVITVGPGGKGLAELRRARRNGQ